MLHARSLPVPRFQTWSQSRCTFLVQQYSRSAIRWSSTTTTPSNQGKIDADIEYHWIDGVEPLGEYAPGGYHPVNIDSVLHNRYQIIDKLGFGGYSTVWLARDQLKKSFVAVKIGIACQSPAQCESGILQKLSQKRAQYLSMSLKPQKNSLIPEILDEFELNGPNGRHPCYTTTLGQGDLKTASFSRLFPLQVARALSAKLALAVSEVHAYGYVHGDIRLRNVLIKVTPEFNSFSTEQFRRNFGEPETYDITQVDGKQLTQSVPQKAVTPLYLGKPAQEFTLADAHNLLLIDFGEAFAPDEETRFGSSCHCPVFTRPPEALFKPEVPLSYPSDIWSLALAIWDIVGMKFLFSESEPASGVAALQIDVLGADSFPTEWWKRWKDSSQYFADPPDRCVAVDGRDVWPTLENAFEEFVQRDRRERQVMGEFEAAETNAFLDLMRQMLRFQPNERLTIEGVLQSEWMEKWALPELEQSRSST